MPLSFFRTKAKQSNAQRSFHGWKLIVFEIPTRSARRVDVIFSKPYGHAMSANELAAAAMALSLNDKVSLAQALWESINAGLAEAAPESALADAARRDGELSSGSAAGRAHDEVMQAARQAIGCA
jgi:hypothetical protein